MNTLPRKSVEETLKHTTALRRSQLFKALNLPHDRPVLLGGEVMVLWLNEFLTRYAYLPPEEVHTILDELREAVEGVGSAILFEKEGNAPVFTAYHLMIADRQYASITGYSRFYNFKDGHFHDKLKRAPVEVVSYNLTEMFLSYWKKIEQVQDAKSIRADGQPGLEDGLVEPEYVRNEPADTVPGHVWNGRATVAPNDHTNRNRTGQWHRGKRR